jgi:hypothetical protein
LLVDLVDLAAADQGGNRPVSLPLLLLPSATVYVHCCLLYWLTKQQQIKEATGQLVCGCRGHFYNCIVLLCLLSRLLCGKGLA